MELKAFWLQRQVFYGQNIVKVSLTVHLACIVLEKVVYLIRWIYKITNLCLAYGFPLF